MLGGLGVVFLGAMTALRRFLLLVLLPIGVAGSWRLARGTRSTLARLVTVVTYVAIPLPYDALARGRWGGLLLWAVAPWLVFTLARQLDPEPFDEQRQPVAQKASHGRRSRSRSRRSSRRSSPSCSSSRWSSRWVCCSAASSSRSSVMSRGPLGVAAGAVVVAALLHLPWAFDFIRSGRQWSAFGGVQSVGAHLHLDELLRFQTGPIGGGVWNWAFLVVAALPLLIGREWRFAWAARAWVLALTCWTVAWVGQQSWFGHGLGPPEALLAPAAVALSLSAGLGLLAFETDLPGYRFGWRQAASLVAAAALVLGSVPVLAAMFDGRWNGPDEGFDSVLAFVNDDQAAVGPYRTAWIGEPDVLPLAGWKLEDGVAYASTDHGLPTVEDRWAGSSDGATSLIGDAFHLAEQRDTTRLGRLLAPMGVRYIVVQTSAAPDSEPVHPVPPAIDRSLAEQLDLQEVLADPHVQVYRNEAWAPIRTALEPRRGGRRAALAVLRGRARGRPCWLGLPC